MNYKVAIYLRLSREDGDARESESIGNQNAFLTKYVIDKGWSVYDVYADDGFTGTDFNRPAFIRLKADVEAGRVNLVITKDLSRLGRDYIDTGYYVEKYFPRMNVRYIAVNDGIDTGTKSAGNDMTGFKSVINDLYAKDISNKVRSALETKARLGQFIGSVPPYGYKRSPGDKHKLIPNEETAPIVKRIFAEYISGRGYVYIASRLNRDGVKSPAVYNKETYNIGNHNLSAGFGEWGNDIIRKMLTNPVYIGDMVQHKVQVVSHKVHDKREVPVDERIVVHNTHEPLVSNDDFAKAREIIKGKAAYNPQEGCTEHVLSGLIYCAKCGARMTFSKQRNGKRKGEFFAICSRYKRYCGCERVTIFERDLTEELLANLRGLANGIADKQAVVAGIAPRKDIAENREREKAAIDKRVVEIQRVMKSLYEDRVKGIIDEAAFIEFSRGFIDERDLLSKRAVALGEETEKAAKKPIAEFERTLARVLDFDIIVKPLAIALVDRILIDRGGIEIVYNFTR